MSRKKEDVSIGTEEEEILLSHSYLLFLHFPLLFSSAFYTSHHSPLTEILEKASRPRKQRSDPKTM